MNFKRVLRKRREVFRGRVPLEWMMALIFFFISVLCECFLRNFGIADVSLAYIKAFCIMCFVSNVVVGTCRFWRNRERRSEKGIDSIN